MKEKKLRVGVRANGQPAVTQLLDTHPDAKKVNILVGDNDAQVRFAERYLSEVHQADVKCKAVELIKDDMVQGSDDPILLRVERLRHIELAQNVKVKVAIWGLDPIERGSAGANAIIRFGLKLLDREKLPAASVEAFANEVIREQSKLSFRNEIEDVYAAIWAAVHALTGPEPPPFKPWTRPWENNLTWMPKGVDPQFRLNALYRELIVHSFAREGDEFAARKFGRFKPHEFKALKNLKLPINKVWDTITVLSAWHENKTDPHICALKVAKIWERQ